MRLLCKIAVALIWVALGAALIGHYTTAFLLSIAGVVLLAVVFSDS